MEFLKSLGRHKESPESTSGDETKREYGLRQRLNQAAQAPWEKLRDFVDEGRPKPRDPTAEEIERDKAWTRFLAPVDGSTKESYTYEPLVKADGGLFTRLVTILPGEELEDVALTVQSVNLLEFPRYEALSYCWGDPSVKTSVKCDSGTLNVTINLKNALLHLRHKSQERVLWIDAICINQNDRQERSQQVGIMRDIYKNASRTIVWLGTEEKNSDLGIDLCAKLNDFFEDFRERKFDWRTLSAPSDQATFNLASQQTDEGVYKKEKPRIESSEEKITSQSTNETTKEEKKEARSIRMNPPSVYELLALRDLASREWFERIWIVQEIALAQDAVLVCGHRSIGWNEFIFGFGMTFINGADISGGWDQNQNFIGTLVQIRERVHEPVSTTRQTHATVLDVLYDCRNFEATDPRDKVYGLLGLALQYSNTSFVGVDYGKNIEDVYAEVAHVIISTSDNLDFLSIPSGHSHKTKNLPSWVPDWSNRRPEGLDLIFSTRHVGPIPFPIRTFSAAGNSTSTPIFKNSYILALSALMADRVAKVSSIITPPSIDQLALKQLDQSLSEEKDKVESDALASMAAFFDILMEIEDIAEPQHSNLAYVTGESRNRAFWRTLCTDITPKGLEAGEAAFLSWQKGLKAPRLLKKYRVNKFAGLYNYLAAVGQGVTDIIYDGDGEFGSMLKAAWYSRFAITEKGYFALVPNSAEVGDEVALFKGGKVPLILRQQGESWRLIGESYVHGIMQGEIFSEKECRDIELL